VLMELSKMEQRSDAVLAVIRDGLSVSEAALVSESVGRASICGCSAMNGTDYRPWASGPPPPSSRPSIAGTRNVGPNGLIERPSPVRIAMRNRGEGLTD
jgi:hypothetical protein